MADVRARRRWRLAGVAIALVGGLMTLLPAAPSRASSPGWYGVTTPGLPTDFSALTGLDGEVGTGPSVVMWYSQWATASDFPSAAASQIAAMGAIPEVTWEPWNPARGVNQPTYRLSRITSGAFDTYITRWAKEMKAWGGPVRLRFAQEANGNWYPWAEGVNGNRAGSYAAAWKHVNAIFTGLGATNVRWVWSPNVPYPGSTSLAELYPGDAYVDEMALDGYNWGTTQSTSTWQSFTQVFGPGLSQLASLSTRPVSIGEVASTEMGGDKAAWISDMFSQLQSAFPQVNGFVWFDFNKETDWRIDSSPASLSAFAAGVHCYVAGTPMTTSGC